MGREGYGKERVCILNVLGNVLGNRPYSTMSDYKLTN